ncbi:sugar transferase [Thioclava dalianensis]|uniref:Sugar transferase n=1 Tax=Thioclava dalianensis TaxID=1185766 RepID=A0A074TBQ1_9RHOB|nr:sugar transferase [Thioclava dalianensis]KEP69144.1 sugar transferase [Thioclava dalianensis]SFM91062.1 Sugar transferase involved in LPS biosynthesis (colanic, teichoic acid) [Thioclava dalianensis]
MTRSQRLAKRALDLVLAVLLTPLIAVLFLFTMVTVILFEKRPYFYAAERMKTPDRSFRLLKFRTMEVASGDSGVSGGHKIQRITRMGGIMRRTRADELPQIWNIYRGDISFVGPRPPLREYVERFPEVYAEVLRTPPGVTGLASLYFHGHEDWILNRCNNAEEVDRAYCERCIPAKAKLDLMYQKHVSVCFDLVLIWRTFKGVFR